MRNRFMFFGPDVGGSGSETVATKVADAVTDAVADSAAPDTGKPKDKDDEAEYFIRRISESVIKGMADLLKPTATDSDPEDGGEDKPRKRKPVTKPETKPEKRMKSFLERLL
jgi:hypothetical protein